MVRVGRQVVREIDATPIQEPPVRPDRHELRRVAVLGHTHHCRVLRVRLRLGRPTCHAPRLAPSQNGRTGIPGQLLMPGMPPPSQRCALWQ